MILPAIKAYGFHQFFHKKFWSFLTLAVWSCLFLSALAPNAFTQSLSSPSQVLQTKLNQINDITDNLHQSIHDLLKGQPQTANTFMLLDEQRKSINNTLNKVNLPAISALAVYSHENGYYAWSGTFTPPPESWFQKISEPTHPTTYLYESSGQCHLIKCSQLDDITLLSHLPLCIKSDLAQPQDLGLIEIIEKLTNSELSYSSPFKALPGGVIIDNQAPETSLTSFISVLPRSPDTQFATDDTQLAFPFLAPLADPHFYAGTNPLDESIVHLLLGGLSLWFGSGIIRIRRLRAWYKTLGIALAILSSLATWNIIIWLVLSLVEHTGIAWWPALWSNQEWLSVVFPIVLLSTAGGLIRLTLWSILLWIPLPSSSKKRLTGGYVPGWFVLLIVIIMVTPLLTHATKSAIQESVNNQLEDWLDGQENLLHFAMETNLDRIVQLPELLDAMATSDDAPQNPAVLAWSACDLNLLDTHFGVEILDINGKVIDRFSPHFKMHQVSRNLFAELVPGNESTIMRLEHTNTRSIVKPLLGLKAIMIDSEVIGYVSLQIPGNPGHIRLRDKQWGDKARFYAAQGGSDPIWPKDCPINFQSQWFENQHESPYCPHSASYRFQACIVSIPLSNPRKPGIFFALIPEEPMTSSLAGSSRLGLVALTLLLPGFLVIITKRYRRTRKRGYRGSFTQQLLGIFLIPVIVLPLVFAVTLNKVIKQTLSRHQETRISNTVKSTMDSLHNYTVEQARLKQIEVEQQILRYDAVVDYSPPAWLILNAQGRPKYSSTQPIQGPLPLNLITQVFQQDRTNFSSGANVTYQTNDVFEFIGQTVMPYPISPILLQEQETIGTFIAEVPIAGDLLLKFSDPAYLAIDIFINGRISASNRPEMFNNGFLANFLPGMIYHTILYHQEQLLHFTDKSQHITEIYSSIQNTTGENIGIIRITTPEKTADFTVSQPHDLLLISTALLMLFGVFFSLIFGRRLAGPVKALTEGAHKVATGDFSIQVQTSGIGETRFLTESFNKMIRDLDHQRRDLQDRHTFISTLLSQLSSAIVAIDSHHKVIAINPAFDRIFNLKSTSPLQADIREYFKTHGLEEIGAAYDNWMTRRVDDRVTLKFLLQGKTLHVAVMFASVVSNIQRDGTLLVIEDVTATVQSSKLQAYSDLARRIAHEVKNPLTPIQLSIEHLKQAWEDGAEQFASIFDNCLTMVLDEVASLEKIASEFSRFARFPKPEFKIEDIRPVLRETAQLYQSISENIQVELRIENSPMICRFDRDQIKRVLINLCQNGLQAMGDTGKLTILGKSDMNEVIISIGDTGRGMTKETQMHLFEPYFSTREEGTGLGLVITRAVIDAHDGDINVDSAPNVGTTFTIRLRKEKRALTPDNTLAD